MFQKIYLKPLEKNEVQLFPYGIDSTWIGDGVFSGYTLFSDNLAKYSSSPEIDSLSFISAFDYFTDSAIVEIRTYNRYFTKHANDLTEIQLKLPNKVSIDKKEKFLKRNGEKELFIEVKKKLISFSTQMVEITILMNRKEYNFPIEFRFISYFDLNGDLMRWSFR